MKYNKLILMLAIFCPFLGMAQSSLTIFSEDGYAFYLILNGQRQNNIPQTNVRIDGLSQPQYAVKIIFDDKSKPEISKNVPAIDPTTSAFADITYKIKTNRKGELKMRYFSATPVQPDYVAPPDMYVMHYGQPAPPPPPPPSPVGGTTVTQTTVTTTDGGMGNGGVNMNVGMGGVNMNVNISDPTMNTSVTQTTTTTTTSSSYGNMDDGYGEPVYNDAPPSRRRDRGCRYPMNSGDFRSAKGTVANASFEDTKLSTAKTVITANCMSTNQIIEICKLFSFEESKLDFAKAAYDRTTDKGNYFKVGNVFTFDASRTELNEYISSH